MACITLLSGGQALAGSVWYVDDDAAGADNGTTWTDAFTDLQNALAAAASGDEIWVAAGTYLPTSGSDRSLSFVLKSGVALYGGFDGTERALGQRDWAGNPAILSGDIGVAGTTKDNSYHVVVGADGAVLDGFTVTGGDANTWRGSLDEGGGMRNVNSSPTLVNVTFTRNAGDEGAGMYNLNSSPTLVDCVFSHNGADHPGGGMCNVNSSPTLTNVTFSGNSGDPGGGMYNLNSSPTLTDVTFSGNYNPFVEGGGMYNQDSAPVLYNVTFKDNWAGDNGGGMANHSSAPTLTNVIFSSNQSHNRGGGMFNDSSSPTLTNVTFSNNRGGRGGAISDWSSSSPTLTNCILWGDIGGEGAEIFDDPGSAAAVTYSIVQGGHPGTGNLDADPLFVDAAAGDLHLEAGSPAIDAGTSAGSPTFDLDGVTRPQDGDGNGTAQYDIGAYEYVCGTPATLIEALAQLIVELPADPLAGGIAEEIRGSLLVKLEAALAALAKGNANGDKVAVNDLRALVRHVEAQADKKVSPEAAGAIIAEANAIIAALEE